MRLDRRLGNIAWKNLFPHTTISLLHARHSDHHALMLSLHGERMGEGEKRKVQAEVTFPV